MGLLAQLREALGLSADADADRAIATVKELKTSVSTHAIALQTQLAPIAEAVGLKKHADATAVLGAIKMLKHAHRQARVWTNCATRSPQCSMR